MPYTEGEWVIIKDMGGLSEFKDGHAQIVGDRQRKNIAIIPNVWNNAPANAHLIVAAPSLHKALKELLEWARLSFSDDTGEWADENDPAVVGAVKAIAKAEGGQ